MGDTGAGPQESRIVARIAKRDVRKHRMLGEDTPKSRLRPARL